MLKPSISKLSKSSFKNLGIISVPTNASAANEEVVVLPRKWFAAHGKSTGNSSNFNMSFMNESLMSISTFLSIEPSDANGALIDVQWQVRNVVSQQVIEPSKKDILRTKTANNSSPPTNIGAGMNDCLSLQSLSGISLMHLMDVDNSNIPEATSSSLKAKYLWHKLKNADMAALTALLERANITSSTDQSISAGDLARDTTLTNNHDETVATVSTSVFDDTSILVY